MKKASCVYCVDQELNKVLMAWQQFKIVGLKGYGGVFDPEKGDKTMEDCAVREFKEESGGLIIFPEHLELYTRVIFYNGTKEEVPDEDPSFEVWFYRYCFPLVGTPISTPEMKDPDWYPIDNLPFESMIQGDPYFIPQLLAGIPTIGKIRRTKDWKKIIEHKFSFCTTEDLAA